MIKVKPLLTLEIHCNSPLQIADTTKIVLTSDTVVVGGYKRHCYVILMGGALVDTLPDGLTEVEAMAEALSSMQRIVAQIRAGEEKESKS